MLFRSLPLACFLALAVADGSAIAAAEPANLHRYLLELAARQQEQRRARFAGVKSKADLAALQKALRESFLRCLGGLPEASGVPPARVIGKIEGDDYIIEKLVFQSLPGYYVPALLYKPKKITGRLPAILSPCGHSLVGKAAKAYQILHINLVKRGYIVLTYDPVGQGERSQFWNVKKGDSRFNLACGEHAVLGTPLYLLGSNLARYRIHDGIRAIDYLASLPEVDAKRIGCVGNSGGGTLTAYIAALDARVKVAAICCYITTLPRRMANRIQADPDTDPEQDIQGFVSEGIDHAGLLALRVPKPTLLCTAKFDFFPIEGARESFVEARKLFAAAGAEDDISRIEAAEKHGLTLPLRKAIYTWFDRKLAGRKADKDKDEIAVSTRTNKELLVCKDGQVNITFRSHHLLTLALKEFDEKKKARRKSLAELLRPDSTDEHFHLTEIAPGGKDNRTLVVCVNGNETRGWQEEKDLMKHLEKRGYKIVVIDPRGVGSLQPELRIKGHAYADPLVGVEGNIGANAFLVGRSLLGMRTADIRAAVAQLARKGKWNRIVLCGRRDSALGVCLAAAVEPAITHVAVEEMPLTFRLFFDPAGLPLNAAIVLPGIFRDFGDIDSILGAIAPRKMLIAAGRGKIADGVPSRRIVDKLFTKTPDKLLVWLHE